MYEGRTGGGGGSQEGGVCECVSECLCAAGGVSGRGNGGLMNNNELPVDDACSRYFFLPLLLDRSRSRNMQHLDRIICGRKLKKIYGGKISECAFVSSSSSSLPFPSVI